MLLYFPPAKREESGRACFAKQCGRSHDRQPVQRSGIPQGSECVPDTPSAPFSAPCRLHLPIYLFPKGLGAGRQEGILLSLWARVKEGISAKPRYSRGFQGGPHNSHPQTQASSWHNNTVLSFFFFFFPIFLGPYLQHMEVPSLGVKLEL